MVPDPTALAHVLYAARHHEIQETTSWIWWKETRNVLSACTDETAFLITALSLWLTSYNTTPTGRRERAMSLPTRERTSRKRTKNPLYWSVSHRSRKFSSCQCQKEKNKFTVSISCIFYLPSIYRENHLYANHFEEAIEFWGLPFSSLRRRPQDQQGSLTIQT